MSERRLSGEKGDEDDTKTHPCFLHNVARRVIETFSLQDQVAHCRHIIHISSFILHVQLDGTVKRPKHRVFYLQKCVHVLAHKGMVETPRPPTR
jgi:hypothetical protein